MSYSNHLRKSFCELHSNSLNVALHLITTPLAVACIIGYATELWFYGDSSISFRIIAAYALMLVYPLSRHPLVLVSTYACLILICLFSTSLLFQSTINSIETMLRSISPNDIQLSACVTRSLSYLSLFLFSYFCQDLSHLITGENTFQSSYIFKVSFITFILHIVYLVPLVFDALFQLENLPILSWVVPRNNIFCAKLTDTQSTLDLSTISVWTFSNSPSTKHTTHWWYDYMDKVGNDPKRNLEAKRAFRRVADSAALIDPFRRGGFDSACYAVETIDSMNEVYVATLQHGGNSDTVFYSNHIDGPYAVWPFCAVYRCLVAVNVNEEIETCFAMLESNEHIDDDDSPVRTNAAAAPATAPKACVTLSHGDSVAFDFSREVHRIRKHPGSKNDQLRITLKIHYAVYPRILWPLGWLNSFVHSVYDSIARRLFLKTIAPSDPISKLGAMFVLGCTHIFYGVQMRFGWSNIAYVLCVALFSFTESRLRSLCFSMLPSHSNVSSSMVLFLIFTSFIHYFKYIGTFYYQRAFPISLGNFKRDAIFFKSLALVQVVGHTVHAGIENGLFNNFNNLLTNGWWIIFSILGSALSMKAVQVIGLDRTYFGSELGYMHRRWIARFPYGTISHPMILGSILLFGSFGFYRPLMERLPWLIPVHLMFYVIHCLQEEFNIKK